MSARFGTAAAAGGGGAAGSAAKGPAAWLDKIENNAKPSEPPKAAGLGVSPGVTAAAAATSTAAKAAAVRPEAMAACLRKLRENKDTEAVAPCLRTLVKVLENAAGQPGEAKFRRLGRDNKALASKLFAIAGAEEFLALLGWEASPEALTLPTAVPAIVLLDGAAAAKKVIAELTPAEAAPVAAAAVMSSEAPSAAAEWACAVCTLVNPAARDNCDACGTKR
eukprot:TRINITY_DN38129_c0_g1_i3.p2 TRINITY_DN38129_c0_g1~~TRINITY_DN38129_c0_g1_i3.p2  ORF type:complete len:222 (-),score=68.96 TRINITY_DN38129_c0_g1_i3:18-683(-)